MEGTHLRIVRTDGNGDVRVACQVQQIQGVPCATGGGDVPTDGTDPHQVGPWGGQEVGEGQGIVDAGVAIKEEGCGLGHDLSFQV
jgi:hypothetical protein